MDKEELEKGRVPLWLDPNDILFLLTEWRKIPDNVNESVRENWSRIAFRASTALHKNGIENITPKVSKNEQYLLKNKS